MENLIYAKYRNTAGDRRSRDVLEGSVTRFGEIFKYETGKNIFFMRNVLGNGVIRCSVYADNVLLFMISLALINQDTIVTQVKTRDGGRLACWKLT